MSRKLKPRPARHEKNVSGTLVSTLVISSAAEAAEGEAPAGSPQVPAPKLAPVLAHRQGHRVPVLAQGHRVRAEP